MIDAAHVLPGADQREQWLQLVLQMTRVQQHSGIERGFCAGMCLAISHLCRGASFQSADAGFSLPEILGVQRSNGIGCDWLFSELP